MNIWTIFDHLLGPPVCQLCGGRGIGPEICAGCYRDLPRALGACPTCAKPGRLAAACVSCLKRPPVFTRARVPFVYAFPVNRLLHRLKYQDVRCHARLLGELAGRTLRRARQLPQAIVPVPLHHRRLRTRGFNQAEEIAAFVARASGVPMRRKLCVRRRDTPPLWPLPATERRVLLTGAFECRGRPPARVAVFDDILTTGATADALARVLLRAGAQEVEIWAIARSPAGRRDGDSGGRKSVVQDHADKDQQAKTVVTEKSPEAAFRQPFADEHLLPGSDGGGADESGVKPRAQIFLPSHYHQ